MMEIVVVAGMVFFAVFAVLTLEGFARAPALVAGVVLIHAGLIELIRLGAVLQFGSITIYLPDVVFSLVFGAAIVRLLGLHRFSFGQIALIGLVGLALFAVARGAVDDIAPTINEFRPMFYFLSGALYFVTVEPTKEFLEKVTYLFYATALLIVVAAILLWGQLLAGASLPGFIVDPYEGAPSFRVVPADSAAVIAQACLLGLSAWRIRYRGARAFDRYLGIALIPTILLLQHRTVWILFLVGAAVAGARDLVLRRKLLIPVIGTAAIALLVLSTTIGGGDSPALDESLERQATSADTFTWRVETWQALLSQNGPESTSEVFLGAPYGRGWERVVRGEERATEAHSFYLDNYLRHGLIGLAALILLYAWTIRSLRRIPGDDSASGLANPSILLALIATQLVFFITFTPSSEQGLILGIAASVALRARGVAGLPARTPTTPDRVPALAR